MESIGCRIRKERSALGLNQADFSAIAGITRQTQSLYEKDERNPDSVYLSAIAAAGADVSYILTGQRTMAQSPQIPIDMNLLQTAIEGVEMALDEFNRALPSDKKAQLITAIYDLYYESDAKPEKSKILRLVNLAA